MLRAFFMRKKNIDNNSLLNLCLQEERVLITFDIDFDYPIMHPLDFCIG